MDATNLPVDEQYPHHPLPIDGNDDVMAPTSAAAMLSDHMHEILIHGPHSGLPLLFLTTTFYFFSLLNVQMSTFGYTYFFFSQRTPRVWSMKRNCTLRLRGVDSNPPFSELVHGAYAFVIFFIFG